jgi:MoxR-like ATPase
MLKFDVTFERVTKKKLSPSKLKEQLQFIGDSAKRSAAANWSISIPRRLVNEIERGDGDGRTIQYTAVIQLQKERFIDEGAVRRRFVKTKAVMERAARRKGWRLLGDEALIPAANGEYQVVNGAGEPIGDPAPRTVDVVTQVLPATPSPYLAGTEDLPSLNNEIMKKYFSRIFDRESHIRIIYDNLKTAVRTGFKTRHHILLKGPPACAKTELFLAFIDWLGDDLIEAIDASTMTKAGLERMLLEKSQEGTLKPILLMEEIEKCHPDNVSCLIQVMDARGKIQRVNANTVRDGDGTADCKIIVWGTCNDEEELRKAHRGAIWSRFGQRLDCRRPDRTLMKKILLREVEEIGGREEWVEPVLQFCYEELAKIPRLQADFDDPRFARALLVGGERLLDTGPEGFLADFRKVTNL